MSNFNFLGSVLAMWQSLSTDVNTEAEAPQPEMYPVSSGPAFNVDGMPMLDSCFDVLGRAYGDSGSAFSDDHGLFDSGMNSFTGSDE